MQTQEQIKARRLIVSAYGTSKNFITPDVIEYGLVSRNTAYELSTGEFMREKVYGVTLAREKTKLFDESKSFDNIDAALNYITLLKEKAA